ncbi:DUF4265 domain-containing protein [Paludisphaera sp.]|uniref:DUF4265 domain-containing protein n=1 Tax=Paludisphaera sp. TaxID=2017432 RepID=UPI00301CAEBF
MKPAKVRFLLERDDIGYPPFENEDVWARERPDGRFVIDNSPLFATGAACGDVVEARREGADLIFTRVHERSGNALVRLFFSDDRAAVEVSRTLLELGCELETGRIGEVPVAAANVPKRVDYATVRAILDEAVGAERLHYEEAVLPGR